MQSYQSVVPLKGQKDFKKDFKGLLKDKSICKIYYVLLGEFTILLKTSLQ